jgi:hypothetical protein
MGGCPPSALPGLGVLGVLAAQGAPAAAGADPADLLDVDVQQLPGPVALVPPDGSSAGTVHPGQPVQTVAAQHGVDGAGGEPDQGGDAGRPELAVDPQPQHGFLDLRRGSAGQGVRGAAAVVQPARDFGVPAGEPLVAGGGGAAQLLDHVRDRPALLEDPPHQSRAAVGRQTGISVRQEDLRAVVASATTDSPAGGDARQHAG